MWFKFALRQSLKNPFQILHLREKTAFLYVYTQLQTGCPRCVVVVRVRGQQHTHTVHATSGSSLPPLLLARPIMLMLGLPLLLRDSRQQIAGPSRRLRRQRRRCGIPVATLKMIRSTHDVSHGMKCIKSLSSRKMS